jgi:hypothetical protein
MGKTAAPIFWLLSGNPSYTPGGAIDGKTTLLSRRIKTMLSTLTK